ncbi:MAG: methyltransferase domain-containing protein [Gammaproteobacteria bacterium]|nr:methyltransferase domain-containing protein [Gammaproteobacteria bacterium]
MKSNISYYSKNAESLSQQYNSVTFESVHRDWLEEIPSEGFVLDVGAGSGRDARYLADRGLSVVAVEPSPGIRDIARQYQIKNKIHWLSDSLPELTDVFSLQTKFDLILLSAVWMHIAPTNRERCIRKLSSLLKPNGKIIISLRHGECSDERVMHPVSADELAKFASQFGLSFKLLSTNQNEDELGRAGIYWETVMLQLPDDGTGAFPLIRNIAVNDNKSSTYKLALLRTLLRIAEGHPGAVIERTDEHVVLPMGLVSLYWTKLFKPLVDKFEMQQNNDASKGLGFIKDDGWKKIISLSVNDLYLGASYQTEEVYLPLYKTLKEVANTIKNMPVKFTKIPGSQQPVFSAETNRTVKPNEGLILNSDFLSSLGNFYVPVHVWDSLTRYSVWIEPTLVNEWSAIMASYQGNKANSYSKLDYLNALTWEDPERSTTRVRKRVDQLISISEVSCCWSGKSLRESSYAVDHAFPFSRWPNNDLWNLLPTKSAINLKKSDKLPTSLKLTSAREFITSWWQLAWPADQEEFFTQANYALPNLQSTNRSFDDVFEAFCFQRDRIKDLQQLEDWR